MHVHVLGQLLLLHITNSKTRKERKKTSGCIVSSLPLQSNHLCFLISPLLFSPLPRPLRPPLILSLFIRRLPPSLALVSPALSIIVIACSSESPHISPLIIPLFLSSIFAHPSRRWIIPSSLTHLSPVVSLSLPFFYPPFSPASSSLSSSLNPNAAVLIEMLPNKPRGRGSIYFSVSPWII